MNKDEVKVETQEKFEKNISNVHNSTESVDTRFQNNQTSSFYNNVENYKKRNNVESNSLNNNLSNNYGEDRKNNNNTNYGGSNDNVNNNRPLINNQSNQELPNHYNEKNSFPSENVNNGYQNNINEPNKVYKDDINHPSSLNENNGQPIQQMVNDRPMLDDKKSNVTNNNTTNLISNGSNIKEKNRNNVKQNVQNKAAKTAANFLPPGISQAVKTAIQMQSKGKQSKNLNWNKKSPVSPFGLSSLGGNDKNSDNSDRQSTERTNNGGRGIFTSLFAEIPKEIKYGLYGICALMLVSFIVVVIPAAAGYHKIGGLSLSNETRSTSDVEEKLEKNDSKMEDDDFYKVEDEAYLVDNYEELNTVDNVILVAKNSDFTLDNLNDYYGKNDVCKSGDSGCINASSKFFLKMYDLYYLYRSKYNVKLDLSLLMSTLIYNIDDEAEIYKLNLSDYDRKLLVESDWNPKETMELDWNYDYESQYNYLVSNDSSMDMQVLAKNMVTKTTVWKCYKDNVVTKTLEVKDDKEKLECAEGETLSAYQTTYKLDLDKYDEFLLEYIEKKYYLNRKVDNPVRSTGPDYSTDKKPSIMNRKTTSTSSNGNTSNITGSAVIDELNMVAKEQVGNGPSIYRTYMFGYDNGDNWCGAFVSWLFNQVGGTDKYIVADGGAGSIPRESVKKNLGTWYEDECSDSSTVPQAGDIVVYDPSVGTTYQYYPYNGHDQYYSSHVGYVYKVDDNNIYTIEGNWNGQVSERAVSRKQCGTTGIQGINGYYRPNYEITEKKTTSTSSSGSTISVTGGYKGDLKYFSQCSYSDYAYGSYGTICSHGCGTTSLSIVISSLTGTIHDPVEIANYTCSHGGCTSSGSSLAAIKDTAVDYGLNVNYTSDLNEIRNALTSGDALVIAITNGGLYLNGGYRLSYGGHYFVLTGIDENGQIYIADPGNPANNGRTLDLDALSQNSNNRPDSPSFWIMRK